VPTMTFDPENRPVFRRPMAEILADFAKDVPPDLLSTKDVPAKGGKKGYIAVFIPWYKVLDILDWYAPGWCFEVRAINHAGNQTIITVRLIIPTADGDIYREATGIEDDDLEGFGDTASNACAQAVRRAFAMFGGGRILWDRKDKSHPSRGKGKQTAADSTTSISRVDKKLNAVLERFPFEDPKEEKELVAEVLQLQSGKPISRLSDEEKEQLHRALVARLRANAPIKDSKTRIA
jgi:DNA repair RAD52-like protein 1, mitochondrial